MVLFILYVKVELDNVKCIEIPKNHQWCLDLKQPTSDEVRKGVFVSEEEELEIENSRGTAHFLMKWPGGKKNSQLTVMREVKNVTKDITLERSDEFVPIVGFDCRGLEPTHWYPNGGYVVRSDGSDNVSFEDVDLMDDWAEYDEECNATVGIYNLEYKFEVSK